VYTGLPSVIGWNSHQRQQRVFTAPWVENRVLEVAEFYNTVDVRAARDFLDKHNVRYVIVGQLERAAYDFKGLAKFDLYEEQYWNEVYSDGTTTIYEVVPMEES
jgi:uncharacterized membrane protein